MGWRTDLGLIPPARLTSQGTDRQDRPDFATWLRGKVAFVRMARPELGDHLLAELDALEGRGRDRS
jgi:hypothetical protein